MALILISVILGFGMGRLSAGAIDDPGGPTSVPGQMYTIEQIYTRMISGTWAVKMTSFTEPNSGPGNGTMHTLNDLWGVAYPRALAKRVARTGQIQCWDASGNLILCSGTGQDGEYHLGIDPPISATRGITGAFTTPSWTGVRFTDNGDGTVTDNLTSLIWLKNANCFVTWRSWLEALSLANGLGNGACSLTDGSVPGMWRLPNINELHSLADLNNPSSGLPLGHPFINLSPNNYWSSTSVVGLEAAAFEGEFTIGMVNIDYKTINSVVWPVRGGQ